jgi:DNA-binding XRE family transcriptional regulator
MAALRDVHLIQVTSNCIAQLRKAWRPTKPSDPTKLGQETCARLVGLTKQHFHTIEKNYAVPKLIYAVRIAALFGKTVEEVFFSEVLKQPARKTAHKKRPAKKST